MSSKISVAMCTFNGERFLPAQLESIAGQGRLPDELVVCDDGSSDSSIDIIKAFARRAPFPIRLAVNQRNLGTTRNFEKAIFLCAGEIVVLADQDDVWYRQKLERMEKAFLGSSVTIAAFSDADLIDQESQPLRVRLWESFSFNRREQRQLANGQALRVLAKHNVVTGAALAFRKRFIELLVPLQFVHDGWMAFLLATCGRLEAIPEPLMQYRKHPHQQIGSGSITLRDQIAQARAIGPDVYLEEVRRFRELYGFLESRRKDFPDSQVALDEISRKISHLRYRVALHQTGAGRISMFFREILQGAYWRYSEGWKSAAKDLVLLLGTAGPAEPTGARRV